MTYRNKTYVAFASEDITQYRLMTAWNKNEHIDFSFFDAHDVNNALDTSLPSTIKSRLRERLKNTKQAIVLASPAARTKAGNNSYLTYELEVMLELQIPIVVSNLDGSRDVVLASTPQLLLDHDRGVLFTSFQPKILQFALNNFVDKFNDGGYKGKSAYKYPESQYTSLGL